jgi:hypothetical protein
LDLADRKQKVNRQDQFGERGPPRPSMLVDKRFQFVQGVRLRQQHADKAGHGDDRFAKANVLMW